MICATSNVTPHFSRRKSRRVDYSRHGENVYYPLSHQKDCVFNQIRSDDWLLCNVHLLIYSTRLKPIPHQDEYVRDVFPAANGVTKHSRLDNGRNSSVMFPTINGNYVYALCGGLLQGIPLLLISSSTGEYCYSSETEAHTMRNPG